MTGGKEQSRGRAASWQGKLARWVASAVVKRLVQMVPLAFANGEILASEIPFAGAHRWMQTGAGWNCPQRWFLHGLFGRWVAA